MTQSYLVGFYAENPGGIPRWDDDNPTMSFGNEWRFYSETEATEFFRAGVEDYPRLKWYLVKEVTDRLMVRSVSSLKGV